MGPYAEGCRTELTRARDAGMADATSVFFGGGTPSLLGAERLGFILEVIPRAEGCEVTVECNPEDVDTALLSLYRQAGVTRLSLGVQSMVPEVLEALGRRHDPASVARSVEAIGQAGFADRYSVDLIHGAAGESLADWQASVVAVLGLDPPPAHVSAYGLTVEAGTPLAADPSRHPDDDDQADKYELADEILAEAGLEWYELSNWARAGSECAHNQLYWSQGEYRGIGCAAHSHRVGVDGTARRWWNVRTPERYLRLVAAGEPTEAAGEELDPVVRRREARQLELRTRRGVDVTEVEPEALANLVDAGLLRCGGGRAVLTLRGRLLANEVAVRLVG